MKNIITGDETWVYGYDVETKIQSSQWVSNSCRDQKRVRQVRSHVKVMLTVFFDSEGVVRYESIRCIIWKLCNVFLRQSGNKDLMRGGRIDGCSNITTRPHIHRSLSVTSCPNMRLSFHSLRTLQISHQLTSFCFESSTQRWKAAILSLLRRSRQIR
jgi:hypothetical protein